MKTTVYVLKEPETSFYRIGSTHSISSRMKTLTQGNPRRLDLVYSEKFDNPKVVSRMEREIQNLFRNYHYKDSWYKVPRDKELNLGYELKQLRFKYEMEEIKRKQEELKESQDLERERFWLTEYYKMKQKCA